MRIAIGTNLFKSNERQELSVQSMLKLKNKFNTEIELYNVQFKTDLNPTLNNQFCTLSKLEQRSSDYVPNAKNKHLPITSEIFDVLSDVDSDYFIYTNNDIIISDRLINQIKETSRECYPTSRLAIYPISSLDQPIRFSHYQVAGFDTFAVKNSWWKDNRDKFPSYILGFPAWDVHYATAMMIYGKDTTLINKWPPCAFHVIHESLWKSDKSIPERIWNEQLFWKEHKTNICDRWNKYLFDVLLKRSNEYRTPFKNEVELESVYFRGHE